MKSNCKYYKSGDNKLIQFNLETKIYKLRNNIEKIDTRISQEDFNNLNTIEIKRDKFSQLMNEYFRDLPKHQWQFDYNNFKKLPNFEAKNSSISDNYILGKDIPYHKIEGKEYLGNLILVYHWGRVYYHTISYSGYPQGQLINPKTLEIVRWAKLKNCAPIFNIERKKII
jgi:hypothetical protein